MRGKITSAQFFVMMFVSRVVVAMGLNARALGGENFLEAAISYVLAMGLALLLSLPALALHRENDKQSVIALAFEQNRWFGRLAAVAYLLYFVCINAASLALFRQFLQTAEPSFSTGAAIAAVLAVAVYGAWHGLETTARCAACVCAILVCSAVLVFAPVLPRFSVENTQPLFLQGSHQLGQGVVLFTARTSLFADMAVLLPHVTGNVRRGVLGWGIATTLFVVVLLVLLAGCLGVYGTVQEFPVYALSSMTEVRSLQRLDAVFVGVWLMGLVIRTACDLCACRECLSPLLHSERPAWVMLPAVAMLLPALFGISAENSLWLLPGSVGVGVGVPLAVLCAKRIGRQGVAR